MLCVFQGLFHRSSQCTFNAKTFRHIGGAVCYYLYFHFLLHLQQSQRTGHQRNPPKN